MNFIHTYQSSTCPQLHLLNINVSQFVYHPMISYPLPLTQCFLDQKTYIYTHVCTFSRKRYTYYPVTAGVTRLTTVHGRRNTLGYNI